MSDTVVETKICPISWESFTVTQNDRDFYAKISPTFAGQQFVIPTPRCSPKERQRRRLAFRNERNLYRRTCDASGKQIISMYRPDNGYKVYDQKIRYSDSWDAFDYAQEFNFSQSFRENFEKLSLAVPRPSMYNYFAENSDYCNCSNYQKDCYLTSASSRNERCMYASYMNDSVSCMDGFMTFHCENSYMTIDCENSYKLFYASNCRNCNESYFLTNCNACNHCFGCDGLENASYCFQNKQLTKEEYMVKIGDLHMDDYIDAWQSRKQFNTILFSEWCIGGHIRNSKQSVNCYDVNNIENCKNCTWFYDSQYCYDIYSWGQNSEMCYESVAIGENNYGVLFCANVDNNSRHVLYSMHCRSCHDCFWCCGLSGQQYCIFNKQYTKAGYEERVARIIGHMQETGEWWEFFHPSLSPFGYNETVAQEYFPVASFGFVDLRDQSLGTSNQKLASLGYKWSDYEAPKPVSDKVIQWQDLPSTIDVVHDDILQYAIACEVTWRLFRIQPQELVFYRTHHIPLPRKHPDQRHLERLALRK